MRITVTFTNFSDEAEETLRNNCSVKKKVSRMLTAVKQESDNAIKIAVALLFLGNLQYRSEGRFYSVTWKQYLGEANMNEKTRVLSQTESELFAKINQVPDEQTSLRWHELIRLRDDEKISKEQQMELIQLGEQMESLNVKRFEAIQELAKVRGVKFDDLCQQLEILTVQ